MGRPAHRWSNKYKAMLWHQVRRAKRLLPPRWSIVIDVARGSESVRLVDPDGDDCCEFSGNLAEQIAVAIEVAQTTELSNG
jgi:hypothetical protein